MHPIHRALLTLLLAPLPALAQTYTPKTIHVDAPPSVDIAAALRTAALPTGVPLTKQQIEAALQRVADTGLFSHIAYTVDSTALVLKLTPSASTELQPVHFANFVWWQPGQLEPLLEAAVPGYHGQLPLTGTLTDQVKAALIDLLHAKAIDAMVDAHQSGSSTNVVILSITNPSILIGDLHLQNALPALQPQLTALQHRLLDQDFDTDETTRSVQESVNDLYEDAGYLAVATTAPTYSAPRKDLLNYAVDLTATVTPGDLYHVTALTLRAQPPVAEADLQAAANIHVGDIASPAAQRLARSEMKLTYARQGFYDAQVLFTLHADNQAHTVAYVVNFAPGPVYHFGSIDTSALALDQQAAFARAFTPAPNAVANADLTAALQQALHSLRLPFKVNPEYLPDPSTHTLKIILRTPTH
jgi:outer membrane protein assembly factor BamA